MGCFICLELRALCINLYTAIEIKFMNFSSFESVRIFGAGRGRPARSSGGGG